MIMQNKISCCPQHFNIPKLPELFSEIKICARVFQLRSVICARVFLRYKYYDIHTYPANM